MLPLRTLVSRPWQHWPLLLLCGIALLFLGVALGGGTREHLVAIGTIAASIGTPAAGIFAVFVALGQLKVARQRHEEQTRADLQRRVTESFAKAVEQLGSEKLEVRLGGIYTLERIARESVDDYWPSMEVLTAFVRERARWKGGAGVAVSETVARYYEDKPDQDLERGPPTDIVAVLTVIGRRSDKSRALEDAQGLRFNLHGADLRSVTLGDIHFEKSNLHEVQLERAILLRTRLKGANLGSANLRKAKLFETHLEGAHLVLARLEKANLLGAHLQGALLVNTHLEGAHLFGTHLEGAHIKGSYFEGANLSDAIGMTQDQLDESFGDEKTILPEGLDRPAHWVSASSGRD